MIVLDTNVLSELMRLHPKPLVINWLDIQDSANLFLTAITVAEVLHGIARTPDGKRKNALRDMAHALFDDDFSGRILPFDGLAAVPYAELVCARERAGRPISLADAQIAAICLSRQAVLATRNTKDFIHTGVELFDPWAAT